MIKSYFLVALRALSRNRLHATINITGLVIGMVCCALITLFVLYELSYDSYNRRADQVYRMGIDLEANKWAISAFPIGQVLKDNLPEVEAYTRIMPKELKVRNNDADIKLKEKVFYADSSVFDVLDLKLISGDASTALAQANSMVLTPEKARIYFGDQDPIGKTLTIVETKTDFKVTGILKPMPGNSHVHIDMMVSSFNHPDMRPGNNNAWNYLTNHYTYLILPAGTDPDAFGKKISELMDKIEERPADGDKNHLVVQPVTSIHLYSNRGLEVEANGSMSTVYTMSAIAFFILVIACINFMNLTTAQSMKRAREVGIRKVVGSNKSQLVVQFLSESILISIIALIIAVGLLTLVVPVFNEMAHRQLEINPMTNGWVLVVFLGIIFFVGVLAGAYPAFAMSQFKPAVVLKGAFVSSTRGQLLRKGLVVFQFAIAFVIMVGTYVIYSQLDFMLNKNMGFNREEVLVVRLPQDSIGDTTLKNEFLKVSGVESVTRFLEMPGKMVRTTNFWHEGAKENKPENMYYFDSDEDLLKTLGMKMKAGRFFDKDSRQYTKEFVINEAALKHFGWTLDDAIGKQMDLGDRSKDPGKVIGVVEDFHFKHLHDQISPLVMVNEPAFEGQLMALKINSGNVQKSVADIETTWKSIVPGYDFEYQFLDESFDKLFDEEKRLGSLFGIFSGIAIFVSCLGLFGLASFTMEQSRKSVAVRKVMGATVSSIVVMMSRDFLRLVFLGLLLAAPLAWYLTTRWLNGFAYNVGFNWLVFVYAAVAGAIVAFLTVSYHSVRAATTNPVNSLKDQ